MGLFKLLTHCFALTHTRASKEAAILLSNLSGFLGHPHRCPIPDRSCDPATSTPASPPLPNCLGSLTSQHPTSSHLHHNGDMT